MSPNFLLVTYRISGWTINLLTLAIAWLAIKNGKMWKDRYLFLAINFCAVAGLELISSITALISPNNHWVSFIDVIIEFSMMMIYLMGQYKTAASKILAISILLVFISFEVYQAVDLHAYNEFNAIGIYTINAILLLLSMLNLILLFKQKGTNQKLRMNPNFWFTGTIFCMCFLDLANSFIADATYASRSAIIWYSINIPRNFLKAILLYGYYNGIKLLR